MLNSMKTNKDYSGLTDIELVREVQSRYEMTARALADVLIISESRISKVKAGVCALRPAVRRKLESMLWLSERDFVIDGIVD